MSQQPTIETEHCLHLQPLHPTVTWL